MKTVLVARWPHRQLLGAKTARILHCFTRPLQIVDNLLISNLLLGIGQLLLLQVSLYKSYIFEQINGALPKELVALLEIIELLVTTSNIIIDYG